MRGAEAVTKPDVSTSENARVFSTLFARMLVPFAAALVLGTVVAWWIGTTLLSRTLEQRVSEQLHHAADLVSQRSFPVAAPVLERLNRLLQASVFLIDSDGRFVFLTKDQPTDQLQDALQSRYGQWQVESEVAGEFQLRVAGLDYLLVIRQADVGARDRLNAVAAFSNLADVRAATRRGGVWLATLAFFGISALALIGYRVARSITVPVAELADMAADIAAGERAVQVDVRREDEVGALARALNTMSEHLGLYEERLVEQSRLATLGELSAKVAHEIRNPLTAIKMQLQLLEDDVADRARPRLNSLLDEVSRLELIVASTLQLGRADKLQRQPLQLNEQVSEVVRLLEPQFQHRQVTLQMELSQGLPDCMLDASRVKQVVLNLLNNAAEELPEGGVVRVSTSACPAGGLLLEIADSGPGVPPEHWDKLFELGGSDKATGFGLGLRVTRELVELHGGSVEVGQSDLGGARFQVRFPLEK